MNKVFHDRITLCAIALALTSSTCAGYEQRPENIQLGSNEETQDLTQSLLAAMLLSTNPVAAAAPSAVAGRGRGGQLQTHMVESADGATATLPALPTELSEAEASWLPELTACMAVESALEPASQNDRLNEMMNWLQKKLMSLGATDDQSIDAWEDFITFGRSWTHVKDKADISGTDIAEQLWQNANRDFLAAGGVGGSLILLLPQTLPLPLFDKVTEAIRQAAVTHINPKMEIQGHHPGQGTADKEASPVPVILLFSDNPKLGVQDDMDEAEIDAALERAAETVKKRRKAREADAAENKAETETGFR
jgi:hypothetical protein